MNFYKRYPGDYAKKTARLTLAQHGAYTLLLDEIYVSESPLPAGLDDLYRICRAMTKPEQDAVRTVADAFFPIGGDGLRHNQRAAEEMAAAAPAIEAARLNGRKGGRPKKKPKESPSENPPGSSTETQEEPNSKAPHSSERDLSTDVDSSLGASATGGEATKAMRRAGLADANPSNPKLRALLDAGISTAELADAAREAVDRGKGFAYALAVAEGRRRDAAAVGTLPPRPAANAGAFRPSAHDRRAATTAALTDPGDPLHDDRTVDAEARVVG